MIKKHENEADKLSDEEKEIAKAVIEEEEKARGSLPPETKEASGEDVESTPQPSNEDIDKALLSFPSEHLRVAESTKEIDPEVQTQIMSTVASTYGIGYYTAINAVCEMVRRGGHANGVPGSFSVEVFCPYTRTVTDVTKRDVVRILEVRTQGRRSLRNLAQSLAPKIVTAGLHRQNADPRLDMSGDLARKINSRLLVRKEPPLTRSERVGCASYAQEVPNLDALCGSDRLVRLLTEDLQLRRSPKKEKGSNEPKKSEPSKGSKKKKNK